MKLCEVMYLDFSSLPFFLSYFTLSFSAMAKKRLFFEKSPNSPDEKQEVAAWPLAFLGLAEPLVLLGAEPAVSEP